jgi:dihydrofolate reductase
MAEFVLYIATTIDGYIARADGSIDWLTSFDTVEEDNGYANFYDSIDALVMGSTTYEQVLSFGDWPYPEKLSYVLTNRKLSTTRADVRIVQGGIEEVVDDTTKNGYQRVWLVGGGTLASSFINQGLVDEYVIVIVPIILGTGISLYQSLSEQKLNLVGLKSYSSGIVELHYRSFIK